MKSTKKKPLRIIISLIITISGFLFTFILVIRSYFINGLIPIGWDTSFYLYYAELILDGQMDIMLVETKGNNFLPSILIALLAVPLSNNVIISRIVFSVILPMMLLVVFYWTSKKLYNNSNYALLSLVITAVWLTTYRLSSDLHRTMIAFLLIVPLFYLYNVDNPTPKNRFLIALLIILASFSQIEVAILFGGTVILLEIWRILRSRKIEKDKIINLIIVLISISPALIIAVSYSTYLISVAITYSVSLNPPNIEQIFTYFGGFLLPFTLIGVLFMAYDLLVGNFNRNSLIGMFNVAIIVFLLLPSFVITNPTLFRRMALRSITIALVPLLIPEAVKRLKKIIEKKINGHAQHFLISKAVIRPKKIVEKKLKSYSLRLLLPEVILRLKKKIERKIKSYTQYITFDLLNYDFNKVGKSIISLSLISLIILTSLFIPDWAEIHQKPFISNNALNQLELIAEERDPQKILVSLMNENQVNAYKDYGWASVYFGSHQYLNGPSVFLIAGMLYPSDNPQQTSAMQIELEDLCNQGINFPINTTDIELAITSAFYGQPSLKELEIAKEVGPGAYLINGSNASHLLEEYSYYGINYYSYEGKWTFYREVGFDSRLKSEDISGQEYITYALLFYYQGNYSISITHRNGIKDDGGFRVYINETYIDQLIYWGALYYRNFTIKKSFDAKTIAFLRIKPIKAGQDSIIIKDIFVTLEH